MTNAASDAAGSTIAAVSSAISVLFHTCRQNEPDVRMSV